MIHLRPKARQFALSIVVGILFSTVHALLTHLDAPHVVRVHLITAVMGVMASLLSYLWLEDRVLHALHKEVAGCLIHHINNALVVITQAEHLPFDQREQAKASQLRRIRWALDKLVPMLEGSEPIVREWKNGFKL